MSDTKTYVFPEGGNAGVDTSSLLAMLNNGGLGANGNWLWLFFLVLIAGWRGNGIGCGAGAPGLEAMVNNDYGRSLLMSAIQGNATAISELAATLNCSTAQVQNAINALSSQVQSVGNTVGLTGQQIINETQKGFATMGSSLASCCCDLRNAINQQGYDNQLGTLNQTNVLAGKIDAQTQVINNQFCALKEREMQSRIDELMERNSTLKGQIDNAAQTAQIGQYIASAINPINAALNCLQTEVNAIKAAQPPVVSVPYPQLAAVPQSYINGYGCGCGYPYFTNGAAWA